MSTTLGVYAGSFDPPTLGHLNVARQSLRVFDKVVVAVGVNPSKRGLFSVAERVQMLRDLFAETPNVIVDSFDGLLVEYCREWAQKDEESSPYKVSIVRGLRALSDFESEMGIAALNRTLRGQIPTVFIPTEPQYTYISSSAAREMARYPLAVVGLHEYVPPQVARALKERMRQKAPPADQPSSGSEEQQ